MSNEELQIIISAQIKDLQDKLDTANKEVNGFSEKAKAALGGFTKALGGIGKATAAAFKVTTAAVAAGAAALVGLSESTREYRTEQAKLVSAFEAAGSTAEQAKTTYNDLYRVLGDSGQATEAAAHLAKLTDNEQELAQWTEACKGIYATFGDSLPIESLTEAANETAKVGQVTGGLADALNWAGISEDAFNEKLAALNTEAEREALIRETLNSTYKGAAAAYEENAASILNANSAQAALTDSLAQLGAAAEPIVTIFKQGIADVLKELAPHIQLVSEGLQDMFNGVDGGGEKLAKGISGAFTYIVEVITNLLPTLITVGIEIILSLIKGIVQALPQIITSIVNLIPTVINTILGALPQLINAVVMLITMLLQELPKILEMILTALPSLIKTILDAVVNLLPQIITSITDMFVMLCESIGDIIEPIIDALPEIIITLIDALMSNLPAIIKGIITLVLAIVGAIPQIIQALVDAIPTIISMLIEGILGCLPQIIVGLIKVVWGIVKALPQIFKSLIEGVINIFAGIWDGLGKVFGNVGNWFKDKFSGAAKGIKSAFSSIGDFFSGIWEKIKSIFSKVGSTIGGAITNAVKTAINAVLSTAVKIINGFISAINFAIKVINAIPGVNIKQLKKLEVPKLAKGGIIESATLAVVGEQGKEAVVPLENNLEWLDKLADKLTAKMGGNNNKPIYLMVDKKVLGQASAEGINDITQLTGSIPLNIGLA